MVSSYNIQLRINIIESVSQACFQVMLGNVTAGCCGRLKLQASMCANKSCQISEFRKNVDKNSFSLSALSLVLRAWHAGSSAAQRLAPTIEQPAYDATQQQLNLAAYPARRWEGRVERNA